MGSNMDGKEFDLYKDIRCRTNGEIYIGVVGPVRTGKSTFIKHFMELCVIPKMDNEYAKKRAVDELPQSGKGKTIMTTEPKFIPQDAVTICLDDGSAGSVLLWIFPVPLSEWPERGLLPFRKNGWDALSFCEYRT